ncbi:GNAT family N-acetyltransferase [Streptomyces sp. NBC_01244]|uniref:GNAT family N-acetyltransferase n=1 Tax=Streptomyces sp. NBC_01244 TaxID=2903797 RepID=UPI002E0ECFDD|nr:GNAT family N-acetyltransferase [Streptomyces sp. NBC_01244]
MSGWPVISWSGGGRTGTRHRQPVGYAFGATQREGAEWWQGHQATPQPASGTRTYALSELMVRSPWRRTGTAHQIHETLLAVRPESLAVLLVDSAHPKVQSLYESWSYTQVGTQQPFPDSPLFAVMVRTLQG